MYGYYSIMMQTHKLEKYFFKTTEAIERELYIRRNYY